MVYPPMGCLTAVISFLTAVAAFASNPKEAHIVYTPVLFQHTGLLQQFTIFYMKL